MQKLSVTNEAQALRNEVLLYYLTTFRHTNACNNAKQKGMYSNIVDFSQKMHTNTWLVMEGN